jgi:hypothetical protein
MAEYKLRMAIVWPFKACMTQIFVLKASYEYITALILDWSTLGQSKQELLAQKL